MTHGSIPDGAADLRRTEKRSSVLRRLAGGSLWRAWGVLGIALLATAVLWIASQQSEREQSHLRFEALAARLDARIVSRLRVYEQMLRSGAALFDTWDDVSRDQWRSYVGRLDLETVFPGIQGIGFSEMVAAKDLAAHVARVRAEGLSNYDVQPRGDRSVYSAIIYLEPLDWRNERAIGFDMTSEPVRRAAMERARDIGAAATSGKVILVQETGTEQQFGFLMYLPIYRGGDVPATVEERRARLRGYVYAPFRAGDLMTGILRGETRGVRIQIFDGTDTNPENLLFDSLPGGAGELPDAELGLLQEEALELPDRIWTARISLLPVAHDEYHSHQPRIVVLGGVAISGLLFLITWSVTRSNDRLRQQELQLRYLFQKNPSVMWVYDRGTLDFLEVNDAALDLYGYSREEFLKMKVTDLRPGADVPRFRDFVRTLPEGLRRSGEWSHRSKDGRDLTVDITSHTLRYAGRASSLVVARDVTDRRRAQAALAESEERFRSIANSMPALLWVSDRLGEITFVNRSWSEFTGRAVEDELGQGWLDRVHPEDIEMVTASDAAARRSPKSFLLEYRLRRVDGAYRWFVDRGTPRFDAAGELIGFIGVLFDITDLKEAQEQLQQAQKMESIGRLTGGIAHDFNNLLTVIEGSAEIIADDAAATPQQHKLAKMIFAAAERGADLTRSMLAFARRQPLEPKVIDVNQVISGMETMLRRVLGEDIDIRFRQDDRLWHAVADSSQLETAILNLAINARDAMSEGGMLTLETANSTLDEDYGAHNAEVRPGDYVMIAVSDTGTGMSQEVLEHAFDPYFTTKPVGRGTGLGLSMVFGFVKQSGGHVKAYSEPGHGTTIRIYLPRDADGGGAELAAADGGETAAPGTEAILLVEDDELVRSYVEGQLRALGYAVVAAPDGAAALEELADSTTFDLLFTDVIMPGGMNGRELADQAIEMRPGIKVLFMSGYAENALTHHGRLDAGTHLLNKPFRRHELAAKLREVLDS